jgi:TonB family protein
MQQAVQRAREKNSGPIIEVVSRPRSAPVNLGVEWGSRREEFRTSLRDFFSGPRPSRNGEPAGADSLRVEFVEQRWPLRGFLASCAWHIAAIWLLILPIWGFLPTVEPTLQTPRIEVTWYTTPEDLPKILLPSSALKSLRAEHKPALAVKRPPQAAAETYHPRQTILSVPVRVTHPRQTLIQPNSLPEPPKIAPDLPNMVQWTASAPPKLQLQISASKAAPRIERRETANAIAPQITDARESGVKLDLLSTQAPKQLAMPLSGSTAVAAKRRAPEAKATQTQAPEISENSAGDANVGQIIALSATPSLAAPKVIVPAGNLAARISMSPEGRKSAASGGAAAGARAADSAIKRGGTLPAAISISGGNARAKRSDAHAGNFRRELGLTPFSRSQAQSLRPSAPARIDVDKINPSLPPETVFSGRRVYTMDISMPNVTSASGSWILDFAELDTGDDTPMHRMGRLSDPEPLIKVDPKYPPDLMRQHVQGEVVLYAIIRKDGTVDSIRVMRSLDPQLDRDAATALAQWKFRPGARAGMPVDIEAVVHIPFNYASTTQ